MKTLIEFIQPSEYSDWKIGDKGYIDGYIVRQPNLVYAVIILEETGVFVTARLSQIKKIGFFK